MLRPKCYFDEPPIVARPVRHLKRYHPYTVANELSRLGVRVKVGSPTNWNRTVERICTGVPKITLERAALALWTRTLKDVES